MTEKEKWKMIPGFGDCKEGPIVTIVDGNESEWVLFTP